MFSDLLNEYSVFLIVTMLSLNGTGSLYHLPVLVTREANIVLVTREANIALPPGI